MKDSPSLKDTALVKLQDGMKKVTDKKGCVVFGGFSGKAERLSINALFKNESLFNIDLKFGYYFLDVTLNEHSVEDINIKKIDLMSDSKTYGC